MTSSEFFKQNGYYVVRNALSEELRDFITQYTLFDEGQNYENGLGDDQIPNSYSKYADPAMETVLLHLHSMVQEKTGLELYPTYSYYRVYHDGDELKPHVDRPACEISCTLCFNYEYENSNYTWPIFVNDNSIILNPGDLLIYKGCEKSHWREKFVGSHSDWHVQGFFHYVDKNGPHAQLKFDRRNSIGERTENCNAQSKNQRIEKSYIKYL
jgi:hypothetical protein